MNGSTIGPLRLLVLQSTPFCNIDCRYCYLPNRTDVRTISMSVLESVVRRVFDSGICAERLSILWHSGEPLVLPISYYERALDLINRLAPDNCRVNHVFQTNGTLLSTDWCRFFADYRIDCGVSIDGPQHIHDRHRVTRQGRGTFEKVMEGIGALRSHGLRFSTIAVLCPESLTCPDDIYEFFSNLGTYSVGFNIEETEGINDSLTFKHDGIVSLCTNFFKVLFRRHLDGRLRIRELEFIKERIQHRTSIELNDQAGAMQILSIDVHGNAATFSPELLNMSSPCYESFALGNLARSSLDELLHSSRFAAMNSEILEGVRMCRATCDYFDLCGGGAPANKMAENGSFATTETMHCRLSTKAVVDAVLAGLERMFVKEEPTGESCGDEHAG